MANYEVFEMNTQTQEALHKALKVLNCLNNDMVYETAWVKGAINACKEALAQPAQEQAKADFDVMAYGQSFMLDGKHIPLSNVHTQPAQEPFGYFTALPFGWTDCGKDDEGAIALYEHPAPAREPLSEEEMRKLYKRSTTLVYSDFVEDVRAIEKAHGIGE